jgi:hypothetical protein
MEATLSKHRDQTEPKSSPSPSRSASDDAPESEKRRLNRSSDDEALLSADATSWQRTEEQPTEPRLAMPTYPDLDWDTPTIPDGKTLDSWDIDERG